MFPEVGASELVVIGVVALLVVGPKDLPVLLRKLGQWMSKIRGLAAEFKSSFSEMARQSELDDLRKEVEALRSIKYDPIGASDIQSNFDEIKSSLNDIPASGLHEWDEGKLYNPDEPEAASDAESLAAPKPKRTAKPKAAAKPTPKAEQAKPAPAKKAAAPKAVATKAPATKAPATKAPAASKAAAPKPAAAKPPVQKAAAPKAAAKKTPAKKGKA